MHSHIQDFVLVMGIEIHRTNTQAWVNKAYCVTSPV
jgi:hypothetical protein